MSTHASKQRPTLDHRFRTVMEDTIIKHVREITSVQLPRMQAYKLFSKLMVAMLRHATSLGFARLPLGLGTFTVRLTSMGPKRLPNGQMYPAAEFPRLVYREGLGTKMLLGKKDRYADRRKNSRPLLENYSEDESVK